MKILFLNSPWIIDKDYYSVKAGSRWASIRPRNQTLQYFPYPFQMCYATALMRGKGKDAHIRDAVAEEITAEECLKYIETLNPDVIVIETVTPSIYADYEFARKAKERCGARIAMAGPHVTALPEEALAHDWIDFVLIGEYEYAVLDLLNRLESGEEFRDLPGLACKSETGEIIVNERRELIDPLDDLPFPERDDVPLVKYTDPTCKKYPNVPVISSRGCPYQCIFCLEPYVYYGKPHLRLHSPKYVVDEIEHIMTKYNIEEIYFDDSSFTVNKDHTRAISEEILARGLNVYWSCMADARTNLDTLKLMARSGCRGVKFGVESANPEILKTIKKPLDLEQVKEFVRNCRACDIHTHGTFMLGLPGETPETIQRTLDFAFDLNTSTAQFSAATPFPGTEFYDMAKKNGWLTTDDWSKYEGGSSPVISYDSCKIEDIARALDECRKRRILMVARNPKVFWEYVRKIYKMHGPFGLVGELYKKGTYLLKH